MKDLTFIFPFGFFGTFLKKSFSRVAGRIIGFCSLRASLDKIYSIVIFIILKIKKTAINVCG